MSDNLSLFSVQDLKLFPMLSDGPGGTAYDDGLDVPGIQQLGMSPEFLEKELQGDAERLDVYSKLLGMTLKVQHGQVSLRVLAALLGATRTVTGSGATEVEELILGQADIPGYFKLAGRVDYLGSGVSGDYHSEFLKGKVNNFSIEHQGEDYAQVSFEVKLVRRLSDGKMAILRRNSTATPIAETADNTPPTVTASVPVDGAANHPVADPISWTFSEAMMPATMDSANFWIVKSDGEDVPYTMAYSSTTKTATLTPSAALDAASTYLAGVTTGVRDAAGNRMAAAVMINFTTAGA
jgi:hypothetical protein